MVVHQLKNIVSDYVYCRSTFEKARGLMFTFSFENCAYIFPFEYERKIPIHMFFVFFPIDVLWINLEGEVVDLKKSVMPFLPAIYHKGQASTLIELPKGTISKAKISLMDKIII